MSLLDTITTKIGNSIGLNTNNLPTPEQGFDVNSFRAQVFGETGLLRKNLFLVTISFNGNSFGRIQPRQLMMYTESFVAPGIAIATSDDVRRYGTGPAAKYPYGAIFTDISANFLADGKGEILKLFQDWMKYIVNYDSSKNGITGSNGAEPYEVAYKDEYSATINVIIYDESANKIVTYTLNEAFPIFLGDIQLSWSDNDSIMRVPVTFTFRDWQTDSMSIANIAGSSAGATLSTLQKIIKTGTIIQTLATLKKPQGIGDAINLVNNASIISSGLKDLF